ncbi:MAG: oligosaccharide flippase family protein [Planctomycetota bacterium]
MDSLRDEKASMTEAPSGMLSVAAIRRTVADRIARMHGTGIKAKSARAVLALGIGTAAGRGVRFVRLMILARILAPDQIGIMAIIMSISMLSEALTEVGVKQSIIHNKRGSDADYLNVAWWMQVARGLCFYGIAALLAPWISSFYNKPELQSLLRVAFLAVVFRSFLSPRAHVLEKEYKFGRSVFLVQGSAILGAIISVALAWVMRSIWALVIGFVAEMAILCILSFIFVPFRPRFTLHRGSLRELMKYSRGMFGLPILTAISFQAPILILGKVIPEDLLGFYYYSALLAYMPIDLHMRIISPVLLPAFSDKQDNEPALCRGLLQTTRWTAFLVLPLIAFMICCAGEILSLAYGSKYVAMAVPFSLLCGQILARNQSVILAGLYLAIGLPHLQRRFAAIRALAIIGLVYPAAVHFGAVGTAAAVLLSGLAILLMQVLAARRAIGLKLHEYASSYLPGLLLSLPVMAAVGLLRLCGLDSALAIVVAGSFSLTVVYAAYLGGKIARGWVCSQALRKNRC